MPPPIVPAFPLPGDGYVLRETPAGWADEQRTAFAGTGNDRPIKSEPVLSFLLDQGGNGWAVGGWSGEADSAGRGSSARNGIGRSTRDRVRTAAILRYGGAPAAAPPRSMRRPSRSRPGRCASRSRGHAQCDQPCADLSAQGIAPDRTLAAALARSAGVAAAARGTRAPCSTQAAGPRCRPRAAENARYATAARSFRRAAGVPGALRRATWQPTPARSARPSPASRLRSAPAALRQGSRTAGIPGAGPGPGARTHYAFDSSGAGGTVRVVVIDNSLGSLAASDPHQNPAEPQEPWLRAVLADARAEGIPADRDGQP